ncbi:MAG: hypothetical protein BM556_03410 [Bacteriovorax sp. MedPE-SWde]|nr:MAG: hypothetical protein BM556_03410 [Bacteriovorax sp. MedPE-SWde]
MKENNFTTLYYFMNEEVVLVEIEFTTVSGDKLIQWFKITENLSTIDKLNYKSQDSQNINGNNINVRVFEDAELRFDNDFGKFQHGENGYIVMKRPIQDMPHELSDKLSQLVKAL